MGRCAKCAAICFRSVCVLQFIAIIMSRNDIEKMFEYLSVFTFSSMGVFKLRSMSDSSKRWLQLLKQVEVLEREEVDSNDTDLEYEYDDHIKTMLSDYIKRYTAKCHLVLKSLFRLYGITLAIFVLTPFLEYAYWMFKNVETGYPHFLMIWSPFEYMGVIGYIITVFLEGVAAVYTVFIHFSFDMMVVCLMILLTGQFELLSKYSQQIAGRGTDYMKTAKRDDRAFYRIVRCHYIHITLISLVAELNSLIKNILGIYNLISTLTLCSVAVRFSTEKMSTMQVISLLQYMCSTLAQLFVFCYIGDDLIQKSSLAMGEGLFSSALWCISLRPLRELHLLSIGMSRPQRLQAGPFISLDLPSFIQIVRTAYSLYAVMRK